MGINVVDSSVAGLGGCEKFFIICKNHQCQIKEIPLTKPTLKDQKIPLPIFFCSDLKNFPRTIFFSFANLVVLFKGMSVNLQVVHLTFGRLWNLARETFATVWSLSKLFMLKNLVIKSLQKIRFENTQNRRLHESSIFFENLVSFQYWFQTTLFQSHSTSIHMEK